MHCCSVKRASGRLGHDDEDGRLIKFVKLTNAGQGVDERDTTTAARGRTGYGVRYNI